MDTLQCGHRSRRASARASSQRPRAAKFPSLALATLLGLALTPSALALVHPPTAPVASGQTGRAGLSNVALFDHMPFPDGPAPSGDAIDIGSVTFTTLDSGRIGIQILTDQNSLHPLDEAFVFFDIDDNPGTGDSTRAGAEYYVYFDADGGGGPPERRRCGVSSTTRGARRERLRP